MLNRYQAIGRLTRAPELRRTASGTAVTNFSLAANEYFTKNGEKSEKTIFTEWTVWNGSGENLCKLAHKGDLLFAEGPFELEKWTDAEGNERSRARFTALQWKLLSSKTSKNTGEDNAEPTEKPARAAKKTPVKPTATEEDSDEDSEIPF